MRYSHSKYSFTSSTGGPQLFNATTSVGADKSENSFTPKVSLAYQYDPRNLYYFTYAKGFARAAATIRAVRRLRLDFKVSAFPAHH